jgi:hypothetical protein
VPQRPYFLEMGRLCGRLMSITGGNSIVFANLRCTQRKDDELFN